MKNKIFCVDIDGTICNNTDGDYKNAKPFKERIDKINELYNSGHRIIYYTARGMGRFLGDADLVHQEFYELTKNQLDEWGCEYDELRLGKLSYDVWIDDKAIECGDFFNRFFSINKDGEIV